MRLCDGASDHPGHRGRGFGTPFRDPDISDPPGAPEHPRQNPQLGDRDRPAGRPSGAPPTRQRVRLRLRARRRCTQPARRRTDAHIPPRRELDRAARSPPRGHRKRQQHRTSRAPRRLRRCRAARVQQTCVHSALAQTLDWRCHGGGAIEPDPAEANASGLSSGRSGRSSGGVLGAERVRDRRVVSQPGRGWQLAGCTVTPGTRGICARTFGAAPAMSSLRT